MNAEKLAKARAAARAKFDAGYRPKKLLSKNNMKLAKGMKHGILSLGLSLAPARSSGYNMCPMASPECERFCLFATGHSSEYFHSVKLEYNPIWEARIIKTMYFMEDRKAFMEQLRKEIKAAVRKADHLKLQLAIRLNVFSDISWETIAPDIFLDNPSVVFYDYTAIKKRILGELPKNYYLTFSLKEDNIADALQVLANGKNITAVVKEKTPTFHGFPTVDGDIHDVRFLDPDGHVVLLKPKGQLANSDSPFIRG